MTTLDPATLSPDPKLVAAVREATRERDRQWEEAIHDSFTMLRERYWGLPNAPLNPAGVPDWARELQRRLSQHIERALEELEEFLTTDPE